ncbi:MAG: hypothetical protein ABI743_03865, partial [bacterium]
MRPPIWFWIAGLSLTLFGCQGGNDPATPADFPDTWTPTTSPTATLQSGEHLSGVFTVHVDPAMGTGTITPAGPRTAEAQPPQNQTYDIDVSRFVSATNFRATSVSFASNEELDVTLRFTHPFAAPDFTALTTAKNRADLGFTGRLMILADQEHNTMDLPGEGTFTWDSSYVIDPDGFAEVGDLLREQGFANNLFPYQLLVDEAKDNRVGVSNGGDP